ncbi:MAG: 2-phosphosulfolactate phosphatase [Bacteroidia bacterium]|nr:2-phosphosulfolactate phosphatase [Bacteroidia bacterium]
MEIEILQLTEGAKMAKGLTVVIDVFRAFSTTCYVFAAGAEKIIPVEHVEEAINLKKTLKNVVMLGERNERKVPGFDFGNSPTHIINQNFSGKTIIMTTSSGTQGIANATLADEIITGSFVNAEAIITYIRKIEPAVVSLVCMGYEGRYPTQEDTFLAEYVRDKLLNKETNFEIMKQILRTGDGVRLLDPANHEWSPASDFELCLDINRFDFVLKIEKGEDYNWLNMISVS